MKQYLLPTIALVFFLTAASAYTFFLNAINQNVAKAERAAIEAATLTKKNSALQAGDALLDETQGLRAALDTFVSTDLEVVKGITLLEEAGRKSRVELQLGAVGVSKPEALKYHELVTIAFAASGSFSEVVGFITMVESLPQISRLDTTVVESIGDGQWSVNAHIMYVKQKS